MCEISKTGILSVTEKYYGSSGWILRYCKMNEGDHSQKVVNYVVIEILLNLLRATFLRETPELFPVNFAVVLDQSIDSFGSFWVLFRFFFSLREGISGSAHQNFLYKHFLAIEDDNKMRIIIDLVVSIIAQYGYWEVHFSFHLEQ